MQHISLVSYWTLTASCSDEHNVNRLYAIEYVKAMQPIVMPSGGVLGGRDAFVHTGDVFKARATRIMYMTRNFSHNYTSWAMVGYTLNPAWLLNQGKIECAVCGITEVSVGHVFPRSFGGIFNPDNALNCRPQCKLCNSRQRAHIQTIDMQWLQTHYASVDWLV